MLVELFVLHVLEARRGEAGLQVITVSNVRRVDGDRAGLGNNLTTEMPGLGSQSCTIIFTILLILFASGFSKTTDFILYALVVPGSSWNRSISLDTRRDGVAIQSLIEAVIAIFGRFDFWAFKAYLAVYALVWALVI